MKILIVDDSKVMRAIVKRTLRQAGFGGHETVEAENGQAGFDAVQAHSPDVVLSDWNMPELNGIGFLRKLREAGSDVKFGFVTSEGSDEMRSEAMEAGALFLLTKPFTPDAMETALGPLLAA